MADPARNRDYVLNVWKSANKQEEASKRNAVELKETEGGLVISLNLDTYKLLRQKIEEHYVSDKLPSGIKCKVTPSLDQTGQEVDSLLNHATQQRPLHGEFI